MDHQAFAFQYYEHAYELWLNELDVFAEANEVLEFRYSKSSDFIEHCLHLKCGR